MRSLKRRHYRILLNGKLEYKENSDSPKLLGTFDISGRLTCSRDFSDKNAMMGLSIFSSSTGRKLNVLLDDRNQYRKFCIAIAQTCLFHNLATIATKEGWSEEFVAGVSEGAEVKLENKGGTALKTQRRRLTAMGSGSSSSLKDACAELQAANASNENRLSSSSMGENGIDDRGSDSDADSSDEEDYNRTDVGVRDNGRTGQEELRSGESTESDAASVGGAVGQTSPPAAPTVPGRRRTRPGSLRRQSSQLNRRRNSLLGGSVVEAVVGKSAADQFMEYLAANTTNSISCTDLVFSDEEIDTLVAVLRLEKSLANITYIDFRGCKMKSAALRKIVGVLMERYDRQEPSSIHLQSLLLRENDAGIDGSQSIGTYIENPKCHLVEINLSKNALGDVGTSALCASLATNRSVLYLNLGNNGIDKIGCIAIAAVLMTNTTLESLDLQENHVGVAGALVLGDALTTTNKTLKKLNLSHQLRKKIGPDGAVHLAKALRMGACSKSLKSLILSRNHIAFEGCRHLAGAMLVNTTLTELDLSGNNFLTIEGSMQLAQSVQFNRTLQWLGVGQHMIHMKCVRAKLELSDVKKIQDGTAVGAEAEHIRKVQRVVLEKPTLRCANKDDDMSSWEFWGRRINSHDGNDTPVEEETAVILATMLKSNKIHSTITIQCGVLPLQEMIGNVPTERLDLSRKNLTSSDAIVVGGIIAENSVLQAVSLHGNDFPASEGENWIAFALGRNPNLKIDRNFWSPAQMYTDGYKSLAALNGTSASGLAIEPQRVEGAWWVFLALVGAFMFYFATAVDIYTIIVYDSQPELYAREWVYLGALFVCLPTFIIASVIFATLIFENPFETLKQMLLVVFQMSKAVETYKSIQSKMETAPLLDYRFMESIFKGVPQVTLQLYIMFVTAIDHGTYSFAVLISSALSLVSLSTVMCLLYDRQQIRLVAMAPAESNPVIVQKVASLLAMFGLGNDGETVQELTNFNSYYVAHWVFSIVSFLLILVVRGIALCWLLAVAGGIKFVVFLTIYFIRIGAIFTLDSNARIAARPWFRVVLLGMQLCVTDSSWTKDEEFPVESFNAYKTLAVLTTLENAFAVMYAAFLTVNETGIPRHVGLGIFLVVCSAIMLRWLLLFYWFKPVHYPELMSYNEDEEADEEEYAVSEKNDLEMIRMLTGGGGGGGSGLKGSSGSPDTMKKMKRVNSDECEAGAVSATGGAGGADGKPSRRGKLAWQPSRKGFHDLRKKMNARLSQEAKQKRKSSEMEGTATKVTDSPESKRPVTATETETETPAKEGAGPLSVQIEGQEETQQQLQLQGSENEDEDEDDGLEKLLYLGLTEKSGPSSMIWYPWLARLMVISTENVYYFSVPYLEADGAHSTSVGFKTPTTASLGRQPKHRSSAVSHKIQDLIKRDLSEIDDMLITYESYPDGGFAMIMDYFETQGYKQKGYIPVQSIMGVAIDIHKDQLIVNFVTSARVYHFRTDKLDEKKGLDYAVAVMAGEESAVKKGGVRPLSVSQRTPMFSGGVETGDIELGLKK